MGFGRGKKQLLVIITGARSSGTNRSPPRPPPSESLTHTRRMDGFCNQNAEQLGSFVGLSFLTVYVGVVECAPASPYTYSSFTHRFPDERTPIEATPFQRHLRSFVRIWVWVWDWVHTSPRTLLHMLPFFSPLSFHTKSLSLAFTRAIIP